MVEDQFGKKIVLITGLGSIGQRHVRCLREIYDENIEIHAYRHRNLNQIIDDELRMTEGDPSKKYGIIIHDDLDVALICNPEAVFITNPPDLHIETAIKVSKNKFLSFVVFIIFFYLFFSSKLAFAFVLLKMRHHPTNLLPSPQLNSLYQSHHYFLEKV